jgi:hypothetical protein
LLKQLANAVHAGCTTELFNLDGANMMHSDLIDHTQYKIGFITLVDVSTGSYYLDVNHT